VVFNEGNVGGMGELWNSSSTTYSGTYSGSADVALDDADDMGTVDGKEEDEEGESFNKNAILGYV